MLAAAASMPIPNEGVLLWSCWPGVRPAFSILTVFEIATGAFFSKVSSDYEGRRLEAVGYKALLGLACWDVRVFLRLSGDDRLQL